MSKALLSINLRYLDQAGPYLRPSYIAAKTITTKAEEKKIAVSFSMFTFVISSYLK